MSFGSRRMLIQTSAKGKDNPYLKFVSSSYFKIQTNNLGKNWDGTIEVRAVGPLTTGWEVWSGEIVIGAFLEEGKYVIYMRGYSNTKITGNPNAYYGLYVSSNSSAEVDCVGNLNSLIQYGMEDSDLSQVLTSYCFANLFNSSSCIHSLPKITFSSLPYGAFYGAFENCTALLYAPELPAVNLNTYCYYRMFAGCTSLIAAPSLPATTLYGFCYQYMFFGCTSLTVAPPSLPATTLVASCYVYMFYGCTSLTVAPSLPATALTTYCYQYMFAGCTSLIAAPSLPATTLAVYCYYSMFSGCTSLTAAPSLPANRLAGSCYQNMFKGCTQIKLSLTQSEVYQYEYRIPTSGDGTTTTYALTDMFSNTGGTFTGTPAINTTYYTDHEPV